ncbi:hypothetical protein [Ancylobacter sp. G4_0304]|uniref:hypothetical protein n=1 Tax=Ancylobacter sp. G4_0304 TaxID=3114289 RepID=UPI0039C66D64
MPPSSETTSSSYSVVPARLLATSNAAIEASPIIWKSGLTTKPIFIVFPRHLSFGQMVAHARLRHPDGANDGIYVLSRVRLT